MVWEATTKQESTTFGRYWSFRNEKEGSCGWIAGPSPAMTIFYNNPYRKPRFYSGLNAKVSEQHSSTPMSVVKPKVCILNRTPSFTGGYLFCYFLALFFPLSFPGLTGKSKRFPGRATIARG